MSSLGDTRSGIVDTIELYLLNFHLLLLFFLLFLALYANLGHLLWVAERLCLSAGSLYFRGLMWQVFLPLVLTKYLIIVLSQSIDISIECCTQEPFDTLCFVFPRFLFLLLFSLSYFSLFSILFSFFFSFLLFFLLFFYFLCFCFPFFFLFFLLFIYILDFSFPFLFVLVPFDFVLLSFLSFCFHTVILLYIFSPFFPFFSFSPFLSFFSLFFSPFFPFLPFFFFSFFSTFSLFSFFFSFFYHFSFYVFISFLILSLLLWFPLISFAFLSSYFSSYPWSLFCCFSLFLAWLQHYWHFLVYLIRCWPDIMGFRGDGGPAGRRPPHCYECGTHACHMWHAVIGGLAWLDGRCTYGS